MIVEDITLFANRRASFFGRLMSAAMAVLLVVSFFGLTANPASAYALESDASPAEEQPSDDVAVPQNVYVYLQLSGDAAKAAEQLGLTHNNDGSQKWFTIGVIQLDIPEAAAEEVLIEDDATPMVSRAPGAEVIVAEAVPLGAFDAPVDPAPWVAGMGAIGTALWGVIAVRRRLVMAQRLVSFEGQVLGNAVAEPDAVAVPNAGHQAL